MRFLVMGLVLVLAIFSPRPTHARGYIFNRFRPQLLYNGGYGDSGRLYPSERLMSPNEQLMEALFEREVEEQCEGRRCTSNEHCCLNSICVDFNGVSGTCMTSLGQEEGAICASDPDCAAGLICDLGICAAPRMGNKLYNEPCSISSECNVERGLCCQLVRRHRQAPKQMCVYFKDPRTCIGHVAADQVQQTIDHTKGEKRLTSKSGEFGTIKK
ncbi:space blanket [Oratosquilla oratoria]|uniref:space blanket n=1 Tax=Oratosquilla oratoria TaxID=337810 RepID=UPI003F75BB42